MEKFLKTFADLVVSFNDVVIIYNNKVFIGHVGDSRVYRVRKNIIRKLTQDHSYVEKLVRDGSITKEEAFNHPNKNMLLKAVGCNNLVNVFRWVNKYAKRIRNL